MIEAAWMEIECDEVLEIMVPDILKKRSIRRRYWIH